MRAGRVLQKGKGTKIRLSSIKPAVVYCCCDLHTAKGEKGKYTAGVTHSWPEQVILCSDSGKSALSGSAGRPCVRM